MPKTKNVLNLSSGSDIDKMSVPGINIKELLEFEDILPEIRKNLAIIMLPIVAIAQIRLSLSQMRPGVVQGLPSVNLYYRTLLAKSKPLLYVTSAVAIRRTAIAYTNDDTSDGLVRDHFDLYDYPAGPIITRGGVTSALGDPAKLRAFRRGLMAKATGEIQSVPLHYPRRIARDVERISSVDFLNRLPFETKDIDISFVYETVNKLISPSGDIIECVEQPTVPPDTALIEKPLLLIRKGPTLPDLSSLPTETSKLPGWKRAAILQAKNMGGNL